MREHASLLLCRLCACTRSLAERERHREDSVTRLRGKTSSAVTSPAEAQGAKGKWMQRGRSFSLLYPGRLDDGYTSFRGRVFWWFHSLSRSLSLSLPSLTDTSSQSLLAVSSLPLCRAPSSSTSLVMKFWSFFLGRLCVHLRGDNGSRNEMCTEVFEMKQSGYFWNSQFYFLWRCLVD